jgi:hypothetical protein
MGIQPSLLWLPGNRQIPVMPQVMAASQGQTRTVPTSTATQPPTAEVRAGGSLGGCARDLAFRRELMPGEVQGLSGRIHPPRWELRSSAERWRDVDSRKGRENAGGRSSGSILHKREVSVKPRNGQHSR